MARDTRVPCGPHPAPAHRGRAGGAKRHCDRGTRLPRRVRSLAPPCSFRSAFSAVVRIRARCFALVPAVCRAARSTALSQSVGSGAAVLRSAVPRSAVPLFAVPRCRLGAVSRLPRSQRSSAVEHRCWAAAPHPERWPRGYTPFEPQHSIFRAPRLTALDRMPSCACHRLACHRLAC